MISFLEHRKRMTNSASSFPYIDKWSRNTPSTLRNCCHKEEKQESKTRQLKVKYCKLWRIAVQSENLARMGDKWVNSQSDGIRDMVSGVKVELNDSQWEEWHEIYVKIGHKTVYRGIMDMEFIVDPTGGIYLLECNLRFLVDCIRLFPILVSLTYTSIRY